MDKGKNMTELKIGKKSIPTASMSAFSSLPPIAFNIELGHINEKFLLGEDDGLFINYGKINGVFPYCYQDCYTRTLSLAEYDIVVLENEYLKATFMPCFGGKLWPLYDKKAGKELFVWGNSQGGHKWMNFLTADNESGRYDEIQCGLAATQYESLPMPPHTV